MEYIHHKARGKEARRGGVDRKREREGKKMDGEKEKKRETEHRCQQFCIFVGTRVEKEKK